MATENISISTHNSLQFQVIKTQNPLKKESKNLNVLTPKFERHPSAAKLLNSEEQEIKEIYLLFLTMDKLLPVRPLLPVHLPLSSTNLVTLYMTKMIIFTLNQIIVILTNQKLKKKENSL